MLKNERGMVLPMVMMIMLLLTTMAVAAAGLGSTEPLIAKNLRDAARARAVAEAGIEWGYLQVANASSFTAMLATVNGQGIATLATNATLPGLTSSTGGTYTVTLRNDTLASDRNITGVANEASTTVDANNKLILVATGTFGSATRSIQAVVTRVATPPINAAVAFPGNESQTSFSGTAFQITGNDYNTTTLGGTPTAGSCSPVYGISTYSSANETVVETSLSSTQKADVTGKQQVSGSGTSGNNTIAADSTLTSAAVTTFATTMGSKADIILNSPSPSGLSYSNIGGTTNCANWASTSCWGTASQPKVVYIKGTPDPTSAFTAVTLSGNIEGHGILIVQDGDMIVNGNFLWDGIVIVTGQYIGLGFMGSASTTDENVFGAVIVNETASDPGFEGVVTGDAKLRYSCQGLTQAYQSRKLYSISAYQEI